MDMYLVTETRQLRIKAPSAAVARAIAIQGFKQKLSPKDITNGMSISNIENVALHVEKVR